MAGGRIHILSRIRHEPWGGGNQFLKGLRAELVDMDAYEEEPGRADAILFNSYPFGAEDLFGEAARLRKLGKTIVQRVAGPFIVVRGSDFGVDRVIGRFNRGFTDGTVFQSDWSREQWNRVGIQLGCRIPGRQTTILNAPRRETFHPIRPQRGADSKIRIVSSSWSSNPRKGFKLIQYLDDHLDFGRYAFTFVGNSPVAFRNIRHIKPLASPDLADELRRNDIYFSGAMNDSCPNALIEAMHCGLPAVALRSGGQPEIVGGGGALFEGEGDVVAAIESVGADIEGHRRRIAVPDIREVASKYLSFCLSLEKPSIPRLAGRAMITLKYLDVMRGVAEWKLATKIRGRLRRAIPG